MTDPIPNLFLISVSAALWPACTSQLFLVNMNSTSTIKADCEHSKTLLVGPLLFLLLKLIFLQSLANL